MPNIEPRFSFGITTPGDMLGKLKRELSRVADSSFMPDDLIDHGINCAFTAWHLVDWVWRFRFADDQAAQDALVSLGSDLRRRTLSKGPGAPAWFKEFVTQECPALALCQDIANGSKHVITLVPEGRESPGVVETTASARTAPPGPMTLGSGFGVEGLGGPGYKSGGTMYVLKIDDSHGERHGAVAVFNDAVAFWTRFMSQNSLL